MIEDEFSIPELVAMYGRRMYNHAINDVLNELPSGIFDSSVDVNIIKEEIKKLVR